MTGVQTCALPISVNVFGVFVCDEDVIEFNSAVKVSDGQAKIEGFGNVEATCSGSDLINGGHISPGGHGIRTGSRASEFESLRDGVRGLFGGGSRFSSGCNIIGESWRSHVDETECGLTAAV